jgi:GNAT superfamily N-acetyltransferase
MKYQQELVQTFAPDMKEIGQRDWEEVQHNSKTSKLNPDVESYSLLEERGQLYIFTCRDDGVLAGYFTAFVIPDLHCKGSMRVVNDAIFLDKPYRKGFTGIRLIKFAEDCLKADGYPTLSISTTEQNPIDPLMVRLGYSKVSTTFEKEL